MPDTLASALAFAIGVCVSVSLLVCFGWWNCEDGAGEIDSDTDDTPPLVAIVLQHQGINYILGDIAADEARSPALMHAAKPSLFLSTSFRAGVVVCARRLLFSMFRHTFYFAFEQRLDL